MSKKESAEEFSRIANSKGYQVISFDLPEHGERIDLDYKCNVWNGIKDLEEISQKYRQTQLFMETPFRNNHLFDDIVKNCQPNTLLCVACNINGEDEFIEFIYNEKNVNK